MEVTSKRRNKGVGLEIPASYTFYYRKPSKIVIKFNLIGLIRDKEKSCSIVTELKDFDCCWSVSVAFVFCHAMTLVRHVRVIYYSFGLLYCVRYIEVRYIEVLFHTVTDRAEEYR